jgi:hypothetical protein
MNLTRQIIANRENAMKSCGPTSKDGKARSSLNARRHGLSVRVDTHEDYIAERKARAHKISGGADNEVDFIVAQEIASAQIDLERIKKVRDELLTNHYGSLKQPSRGIKKGKRREVKKILEKIEIIEKRDRPIKNQEELLSKLTSQYSRMIEEPIETGNIENLSFLATELLKIERYEQRALSRLRTAIRKHEEISGNHT